MKKTLKQPFTRQQNFSFAQIERICRRQNISQNIKKIILRRAQSIVGIGENAGYQHFLLFQQCFEKLSPTGCQKLLMYDNWLKTLLEHRTPGL